MNGPDPGPRGVRLVLVGRRNKNICDDDDDDQEGDDDRYVVCVLRVWIFCLLYEVWVLELFPVACLIILVHFVVMP